MYGHSRSACLCLRRLTSKRKGLVRIKFVYVAHPLRGDVPRNLVRVRELCRLISAQFDNVVPICPILTFSFLNDNNPQERERAMMYSLRLLSACDELWLAGKWQKSEGCRVELLYAQAVGKPVLTVGVRDSRVIVSSDSARKQMLSAAS